MSTDRLIRLAESYARHHRLALSTVGRLAGGHGHFFDRVADGRVTFRRVDRSIQWFSDHWPAELDWPDELPRPHPAPGAPVAMGPGPTDPVAAVRVARERVVAAVAAGDSMALRDAEAAMLRAGSVLREDGRIASPAALCEALRVSRDVYYDVVRRFAGPRGARRHTRSGSDSHRLLSALVASGDTRFALRRALLGPSGNEPAGDEPEAGAGKTADQATEGRNPETPSVEARWTDQTTNGAG